MVAVGLNEDNDNAVVEFQSGAGGTVSFAAGAQTVTLTQEVMDDLLVGKT